MTVEATEESFGRDVEAPSGPVVGAQPGPVPRGPSETAATSVSGAVSEWAWAPAETCTLPTAEQPTRIAEFDQLFASLHEAERETPGWLRLRLDGGDDVEELARDLTAREASCCSFFDFTVGRDADEVVLDVRVPDDRAAVLDGMAAQAESARAGAVGGGRG
ncbi:hypothetical protein WEH80_09345 [Actinomycetes bacterium KLBMP 9759]